MTKGRLVMRNLSLVLMALWLGYLCLSLNEAERRVDSCAVVSVRP
jgi:hypothetical protein